MFYDAANEIAPVERWLWEEYEVAAGGRQYRADFILGSLLSRGYKIAIEVDSFIHHSSREALTKDHQRQRRFQRDGWTVIRYSGSEVWQDARACVRDMIEVIGQIIGCEKQELAAA
jgi:very-short-patch-repair endonuclease